MKAFWRNAALLAVSLLPFSSANAVALQANSMAILIAMSRPLTANRILPESTIEIVTNEMNVACKPKRPTKLIFDRTWSVAGLPKSVAARGVDERRWMRFGCATRPIPNLPEARASRMCSSPETGLSLETAAKLK